MILSQGLCASLGRVLAIVLLAAGASGCRGGPDLPERLRGTLYTQTRLSTDREGRLFFDNPPDGPLERLAAGTTVLIQAIEPSVLALRSADGSARRFRLEPLPGALWALETLPSWISKYLSQDAPALTPAARRAMATGEVELGMTKEEVAALRGWPAAVGYGAPALNLPARAILKEDLWHYRAGPASTSASRTLRFEGGRLAEGM